jgi:predicted nucleotidyltransferase
MLAMGQGAGWHLRLPADLTPWNGIARFAASLPAQRESIVPTLFTIAEIRERLAPLFADPDIDLVILFGSGAGGMTRADSDLDLAVKGRQPFDLVSLTNTITQLLHTDAVDVVDLRRASPLLMREVVQGGRLLYERTPGCYAAFCSLAHRRYVDTAKLRVAQRETIRHFLQNRGAV